MRTTRHLLHAAVAVLVLCLVAPAAYSAESDDPTDVVDDPIMHGNNGSPPPVPPSLFTSPRRAPVFEFSPAPLLDSDVSLIDLLDSPIAFLALDVGGVPPDSNIDIDFDDLGGLTLDPAYPTELVGSPAAGAIPSPGALGLLALAALTLRGRRRRA